MSNFVKTEPCPECRRQGRDRSGDNLAVFNNGKYCFSCGYIESDGELSLNKIRKLIPQCGMDYEDKNNSGRNYLPSDCSYLLRADAQAWLKKYGITEEEIEKNGICWSENGTFVKKIGERAKPLLCFPLLVNGQLEGWCGRHFGDNPKVPKYVTYGVKQDLFYCLGDTTRDTVVLVEDLVSAIKVSRYACSMPLFTSHINKYQCYRLSKYYRNVILWLDPNMREKSIRLQKVMELFFDNVRIVYSERDPKEHSDREIQENVK